MAAARPASAAVGAVIPARVPKNENGGGRQGRSNLNSRALRDFPRTADKKTGTGGWHTAGALTKERIALVPWQLHHTKTRLDFPARNQFPDFLLRLPCMCGRHSLPRTNRGLFYSNGAAVHGGQLHCPLVLRRAFLIGWWKE